MGERGPAPNRSDQRRRRNKPAAGDPTKAPGAAEVVRPDADPDWHPVARAWFESLAGSGQSRFYEPSDWAAAVVLAESMSRELKPQQVVIGTGDDTRIELVEQPPSGAALAAWLKGMTGLLVTEADRRRSAIELRRAGDQGSEEAGDVAWFDEALARLRQPG